MIQDILFPPNSNFFRTVLAYISAAACSSFVVTAAFALFAMDNNAFVNQDLFVMIAMIYVFFVFAIAFFTPIGVFAFKLLSRNASPTIGRDFFWGLMLTLTFFTAQYCFYGIPEEYGPTIAFGLVGFAQIYVVFILCAAVGSFVFGRVVRK
ncbi:hypothetical protein ACJ3XI_06475 [Litorimonas sp. RW-G-Af-16]|uniref:hypothetical protein n=1 Tax=Litorimonas sp. RW-G-Af-16 TaxID=3241168 RepID=UPI00390CB6E2